jgi:hypothetical protein
MAKVNTNRKQKNLHNLLKEESLIEISLGLPPGMEEHLSSSANF